MSIIKKSLLLFIVGFGFVLGSFSSAQIFGDDEEPPITPPSQFQGNVVQSINGATVTLNDNALATGVGEPMFFWYGQLLNVAVKFFPVIVVISCFWLIYGGLKNLGNKNSLESKKSLDNK